MGGIRADMLHDSIVVGTKTYRWLRRCEHLIHSSRASGWPQQKGSPQHGRSDAPRACAPSRWPGEVTAQCATMDSVAPGSEKRSSMAGGVVLIVRDGLATAVEEASASWSARGWSARNSRPSRARAGSHEQRAQPAAISCFQQLAPARAARSPPATAVRPVGQQWQWNGSGVLSNNLA